MDLGTWAKTGFGIQSKLERPLLVFDLETTGKDPAVDEIVQFAGVLIYPAPGWKPGLIQFICQPTIPITPEASKIHGITARDVEGHQPFRYWAKLLYQRLPKEFDVAGFNIAKFDLPILDRQMEKCGIRGLFDKCHILDSFVLYKQQYPRTLEDAHMQYTGEKMDGAHDAMVDTLATCRVMSQQIKRYDCESMNVTQIADQTSRPPGQRIGFTNHLLKNENGDIVFGFGAHIGVLVKDVPKGYLLWILKKDFPEKVKECVRKFL